MPIEEVIELSIEETNKLRLELGLAPLRIAGGSREETCSSSPLPPATGETVQSSSPAAATTSGEAILELSVDETNELRKKLGLKPLRSSEKEDDGKSQQNAFHKPAENSGEILEAAKRIERAKLEREVQQGIAERFAVENLGKEDAEASNTVSWASKMRAKSKDIVKKSKSSETTNQTSTYTERELEGMNVSHEYSELEAGSTTVMTLADAPLLKKKDETSRIVVGLNDGPETLENVLLAESRMQKDGLREKRKLELGMGRAGGYAGFDDDEFEELGGTQASSRMGVAASGKGGASEQTKRQRGFQIGSNIDEEEKKSNDLFAALQGKAISLEPSTADVMASDYMTIDEEEAMKASEKKKKDSKFKKKKKKEKHHKRKVEVEEDAPASKSLLEELERTAVVKPNKGLKRRRAESEDEVVAVGNETTKSFTDITASSTPQVVAGENNEEHAERRAKYDEIMAKGNLRAEAAFRPKQTKAETVVDEEPDDAFLNAALAKARRLQRLREISSSTSTAHERGVDALVKAVQNAQQVDHASAVPSGNTITFAADDTREFTRALRVRAEQAERHRKDAGVALANNEQVKSSFDILADATMSDVKSTEMEMDTGDINELAKDVKEEKSETGGFDGTNGSTAPVGRGLSSVISMLQQTGEITGKRSGREELRGRAKDKRHYDDYEALDLSTVVKIDDRYATEKDKELSKREIKLEYRDKHGRLLTRKEAYRDLCYQFHGHGSSKKREDKRARQIAMEQAEARLASRQVAIEKGSGTTLGALKATQEATGKAFVVHKT